MKLQRNQVLFVILILALVLISVSVVTNPKGSTLKDWLSGITANLGSELIGALLSYWVFEQIIARQEKLIDFKTQQQERQREYISELRQSQTVESKQSIINKMKALDLLSYSNLSGYDLSRIDLTDANLKGAGLANTNWCFAILKQACLIDANFTSANLDHADLTGANLENAILMDVQMTRSKCPHANLVNAKLIHANLEGANFDESKLMRANLKGSNFEHASLKGVNLKDANLEGANFNNAELGFSILPDGSKYSRETDLSRFTKPRS